MLKTYKPEELEKELGIKNHTLYTWIRYAIPEELKPKKVWNEYFGKKTYQFTDKERLIFHQVKELKSQGLKYEEIKKRLSGPNREITKDRIENLEDAVIYTGESIDTNYSGKIEIATMLIAIVTLILNILILYRLF